MIDVALGHHWPQGPAGAGDSPGARPGIGLMYALRYSPAILRPTPTPAMLRFHLPLLVWDASTVSVHPSRRVR
jgi:hypothetical protein